MGSEWTTVALSEILTVGRAPVSIDSATIYEQVTVAIKGRGMHTRAIVPGSEIKTKRQFGISADQLLVSKIDARNGAIGIVPPELDGAIVSGDFPVFDVDRERCIPAYLDLYVKRPDFWDECLLVSEGSTNRVRLVPDQFLDLEIELPSLDEQRAIVAAADVANQTVQAWEREEEATKRALHAMRETLLCAEGGWKELPDDWRACALGDVAEIRSGITKGRKVRGELIERPFIRAANVQDGFLDLSEIKMLGITNDESKRFGLAVGDVLLTEGGNAEHVGRGWLWEDQIEGAVCQNHVFRARVKDQVMEPRFLAYAIGASPARTYCLASAKKTTNLASINKTQLAALPVPVPPPSIQADIVRKLDELREGRLRAHSTTANAESVRSAMVDELVTGARPAPRLAVR
jgi:type I restriction enzyme S subunit